MINIKSIYNLLPLLPPAHLHESDGIGVTSSILPIFNPKRASALLYKIFYIKIFLN